MAWVPFWAQTADQQFDNEWYQATGAVAIPRRPSEYLGENLFVTVLDDDIGFRLVAEGLAPQLADAAMFSTDYPHSVCLWPNSREHIKNLTAGLTDADKEKILSGNAARLRHLTPLTGSEPLPRDLASATGPRSPASARRPTRRTRVSARSRSRCGRSGSRSTTPGSPSPTSTASPAIASATPRQAVVVAQSLGIRDLRYHLDLFAGGSGSHQVLHHAAMAVATGAAEVVVCWRAINARSEFRMGGTGRPPPDTVEFQYQVPYGYSTPPQQFAMSRACVHGCLRRHAGVPRARRDRAAGVRRAQRAGA